MKKTFTITVEGAPVFAPCGAGDARMEREFLLRTVGAAAREAVETFYQTPLRDCLTTIEPDPQIAQIAQKPV